MDRSAIEDLGRPHRSSESGARPLVSVSRESESETETRLLALMPATELEVLAGSYAFVEFHHDDFQAQARPNALALVRDDQGWSQLVESDDEGLERFAILSIHFPEALDNSGFVGWLASRLKLEFGTGVFVVCGKNERRGGIFDYWGIPHALGPDVISYVRHLCGGS